MPEAHVMLHLALKVFIIYRLTIPPYIPESRLDGCDIIDISYALQFKVEVSKNKNLTISVPLVVGTNQGMYHYSYN